MRKTGFVTPFATAAVVTLAGTGVSLGGHTSQRSGPTGIDRVADGPVAQGSAGTGFRVYQRPTQRYRAGTCVLDLSGFDDFTGVSRIAGCGRRVTLSQEFVKFSVPDTWSTWACPPDSENCTPDVLSSEFISTATIDFGGKVTTGGFEYEPHDYQVETVKVAFFAGSFGSGTLVGSITRQVDGRGGARLFAARAREGFRSAVVTNDADDDFAVAQIRAQR